MSYKKAVIYTTPTCAYCTQVKKYLDNKGVAYETVDLEEDPQTRQKLFDKLGAMTVPITNIGERWIIGWKPAELAGAIHEG